MATNIVSCFLQIQLNVSLNLCNINIQTLFFNVLMFNRSVPQEMLKTLGFAFQFITSPSGPVKYYTTLTNFSMKYLVMCNVYKDVGGIK